MILQFQPGITVSVQFIQGFILSVLISIFSRKLKLLTKSGAVAVFVLALFIFGFGGWQWTIPVFSFFIASSLLSLYREKKNPSVNVFFEKSGSRDAAQVLANGGLGGILVALNFFFPDKLWFFIYSGIIASSCADTWATEIGTMAKHKTFNLLTMKKVEQGVSGGVSFVGLLGALAGGLFISMLSVLWIDKDQIDFILFIVIAGFIASIIDSLLGEVLQVQYMCVECNRVNDKKIHCGKKGVKIRGINFINNDIVNLFSGIIGGFIVFSLTGW